MSAQRLAVFGEEQIVFDLENTGKEGILLQLVERAATAADLGEAERQTLHRQICDREGSGSTGVAGIAIPHVKSDLVAKTIGAIGVFRNGVDFAAVDGDDVHCVFLVISPVAEAAAHVELLRTIASLARKPDFCRFVRQSKNAAEVRALLEEMASK